MKKAASTSPLPWHFERREIEATDTCHHTRKRIVLVDANGRDVWHTEANIRLICDCVNKAHKA